MDEGIESNQVNQAVKYKKTRTTTMGDNNEQEAADLDAMMNDDDEDGDGANLFEVRYRGGRLDNDYDNERNPRPLGVPDYHIPDDVNIRLIIDHSVSKIDYWACRDCTALFEVVFHNNVTDIGPGAFQRCSNLRNVELPAGVLRVDYAAFHHCDSLQHIVIPASVQLIRGDAFCNCSSLKRVVFARRTTSIELGDRMFSNCTDLRLVTLPHNLLSIPAVFFYNCTSLTHLQIPVSVTEIGESSFRESAIQAMNFSEGDDFLPGTIILPPNLQSIPESCFYDCKSLTHIRIPPSVQQIGERALNGSDLRSITIPETVNQIDEAACSFCWFLERVKFHSSTNLMMANNIFNYCPVLSVIYIYPLLWPKLFASMQGHPDFLFKFFRQYHTQIFDFKTPVVRRPLQRLRRR